MKKSTAAALFVGLGIAVLSSFAQARSIYWTGYGSVQQGASWSPVADCQAQARAEAEAGARRSCVNDFGYSWHRVCRDAAIERIEDLGTSYDYYGNLTCTQRVYLFLDVR